jgi:hypothetical protein
MNKSNLKSSIIKLEHLTLNRDKEGQVIPEKCDFVSSESDSDEDMATAFRLSQANTIIRWRNMVSQNEEVFMKSASVVDKTLYKQLNNLM